MSSACRVGAYYFGSIVSKGLPEKPLNAIRIICQSDTHNQVELKYLDGSYTIPDGDIYVHAGDFTSTGSLQNIDKFRQYVQSLSHPHKIVIAGNHDITFHSEYYQKRGKDRFHPRHPEDDITCKKYLVECPGIIYLEDSGVEILGIKFWGSPWQPEFYDWAFNASRGEEIRQHWDKIPMGIDVLITHGPPYKQGDRTDGGEYVGCLDLLDAVERIKPVLHVFGHIHEGYGVTSANGTTFVNASTCTSRYRPTNTCVVIDIVNTKDAAMTDL